MGRSNDDLSTFVLGALAGVGLAAVLKTDQSNDRVARRAQFARRIRDGLSKDDRKLLNASFGRAKDKAPFWKFTVQDADSTIRFVRIPLEKGAAPYADSTADKVLAMVRRERSSRPA